MKPIKIFLIICVCFVFSGFGQTETETTAEEVLEIQKMLLSKLTGHTAVEVMTEVGNEKRVVARKSEITLTDRSGNIARKASANLLFESLRNIGLEPKRHNFDTKREGTNIYAILPATVKSDEYIVLGAHYDSVKNSPGANDNASGTALVYGVAYQMAKQKVRKRNFIIVFFDREEKGLIGSRAFAKKVKNEGLFITTVHTVDQVGWDKDGDRAVEIELPTPGLEKFYRDEARRLSIPVHKTRSPYSDHTSFRKEGFNSIGIGEETLTGDGTPHYHKSSDKYQTINFDYLASTTRLVFNVMMNLALN